MKVVIQIQNPSYFLGSEANNFVYQSVKTSYHELNSIKYLAGKMKGSDGKDKKLWPFI